MGLGIEISSGVAGCGLGVVGLWVVGLWSGDADNATLDCCKMRCQTSHLTMQTSKWAFNWGHGWPTCATVYLFASPLPPLPPPIGCLFVCLLGCQSNGWAQGSRMLSLPSLHLCDFLENAAGCCLRWPNRAVRHERASSTLGAKGDTQNAKYKKQKKRNETKGKKSKNLLHIYFPKRKMSV